MLYLDVDGGRGRPVCFGFCTSGLWKCGEPGSHADAGRGKHQKLCPGLGAVGCQKEFSSIKMTGGGHLSAVLGTVFNF